MLFGTAQIARNLTDAIAGPLRASRYLIVDRDPLYTAHFKSLLDSADVKLWRLPARSPNLNAFAERFVRSSKDARNTLFRWARVICAERSECSSRTITSNAITKPSACHSLSSAHQVGRTIQSPARRAIPVPERVNSLRESRQGRSLRESARREKLLGRRRTDRAASEGDESR